MPPGQIANTINSVLCISQVTAIVEAQRQCLAMRGVHMLGAGRFAAIWFTF
jgi:GTP cyclohydrolase I